MTKELSKKYEASEAERAALKAAAERTPNAIPVASLRLSESDPADLPGRGGMSSITAMARDKVVTPTGERICMQRCWVVDYLPSIHHHRVIYFSDRVGEEPMVRMIYAANVKSWEPLR